MTCVIQAWADAAQVDTTATMEASFPGKVSLRRMVTAQDVAYGAFPVLAGRANISGQSLSVCGNVETL